VSTPQQLDPAAIRHRLRKSLDPSLGGMLDGLSDDAQLTEALGALYDSLAAMETISAVEEEFGLIVDLVNDDVRHWFASIARMTQFVAERLEDADTVGSSA
jgi:acyl carrier protein